ncbi:Molybdate-binding protein ModA [Baekduia alba]|uniref:molybdate ABC transporter substrate-binding protein n=1 Tax=Baekduia alba TaxID=2997333 RepID=UPI0023404292|nr:molybdate ABC transporter substrate-binding protein [Baekduia alba]WCB94077.1 Molybdate-binding protein ModA [Baekduia alba]
MRLRLPTVVLAALAAAALPTAAAQAAPTVYAAASLNNAFPALDHTPKYNFAGSNTLQAQIERGAPADVFASASPTEATALFNEGLCTRPVTFATNILVLVVPKANPAGITSVYSLRGSGKRLAIGTAGVPIGNYTRLLLRRLHLTNVLSTNTVSQEKDVTSVLSKVALNSADAGFVYHTDALSTRGRTAEIRVPKWAQPAVRYQICAVKRPGADTAAAQAYIDKVVGGAGRTILKRYGFGLPPRG